MRVTETHWGVDCGMRVTETHWGVDKRTLRRMSVSEKARRIAFETAVWPPGPGPC